MNKYVDFVSDKDFLECIKWVCEAYHKSEGKINMEELQKNAIDPFKLVFDIIQGKINIESWIKTEQIRQQDKTVNNKIGDFHQKLLGKVEGWTDLGTGDKLRVDLKKDDDSIFIELKNKYNTMSSDATDTCRDKLEKILKEYPKATVYWAHIIAKNGTFGEKVWKRKGEELNNQIKKIWGKKVYELVTGDEKALEKTWKAVPLAIKDLLKPNLKINKATKEKIQEFFNYTFKRKDD